MEIRGKSGEISHFKFKFLAPFQGQQGATEFGMKFLQNPRKFEAAGLLRTAVVDILDCCCYC